MCCCGTEGCVSGLCAALELRVMCPVCVQQNTSQNYRTRNSEQERKTEIFTTYGIVSCYCGRQGFGEGQRGTTCTVWRKLLDSVKQLPSYRTRSDMLPRSEPLPTTITGHYTICCKKSQSCAPEDGQKFARNMLSWSWRSIKLLLLHLVGFYITLLSLPCLETGRKLRDKRNLWRLNLNAN